MLPSQSPLYLFNRVGTISTSSMTSPGGGGRVQGAELMSSYGVNVPPGIPVFKLDEVLPAAQQMADEEGKVRQRSLHTSAACFHMQICHADRQAAHSSMLAVGRISAGGAEEPDPGGGARPGEVQERVAGGRAHLQRGRGAQAGGADARAGLGHASCCLSRACQARSFLGLMELFRERTLCACCRRSCLAALLVLRRCW